MKKPLPGFTLRLVSEPVYLMCFSTYKLGIYVAFSLERNLYDISYIPYFTSTLEILTIAFVSCVCELKTQLNSSTDMS